MSAPDPEGFSLLTKVIAAGAVVATPITWLYTQLGKKADKTEMDKCLRHIERLYENAEGDRKLTRDLHDTAMKEVRENQTQLINILGRRS